MRVGCAFTMLKTFLFSPRAARLAPWLGCLLLLAVPALGWAQASAQLPGLPAFSTTPGANGSTSYTLSIQTLAMLTMLSFLPALLLMMTSFTRIIIVLTLLRQAMGLQSTPPIFCDVAGLRPGL